MPNYDCVDCLLDLSHRNNEASALGIEKGSKKIKSMIVLRKIEYWSCLDWE